MSSSKLFLNNLGDRAVLGCACGDLTHGGLALKQDGDDHQMLVSVWFVPPRRLGARIAMAWGLVLGRTVSTDLLCDGHTASAAADWLLACVGSAEGR